MLEQTLGCSDTFECRGKREWSSWNGDARGGSMRTMKRFIVRTERARRDGASQLVIVDGVDSSA
eukprot:1101985-Rhodomonas_salina.1